MRVNSAATSRVARTFPRSPDHENPPAHRRHGDRLFVRNPRGRGAGARLSPRWRAEALSRRRRIPSWWPLPPLRPAGLLVRTLLPAVLRQLRLLGGAGVRLPPLCARAGRGGTRVRGAALLLRGTALLRAPARRAPRAVSRAPTRRGPPLAPRAPGGRDPGAQARALHAVGEGAVRVRQVDAAHAATEAR